MQDQQKSPRAKHCEVVSDVEHIKVDIQAVIREKKSIKQYAYILHDKDDTAPHYHIYLNFGTTSVSFDDVGRWFGLSASFVSKVNGRKVDMLEYLTHANESQKHKHQYSPSEVVANFDFETEIAVSKILGNFDQYSYAQQLEYVNSLSVDEKAKAFSKLEKLWKLHCQCLLLKADRQIEVMFIQGKGGSGKTYYAKRLLEKMGYDYAISSSSNDHVTSSYRREVELNFFPSLASSVAHGHFYPCTTLLLKDQVEVCRINTFLARLHSYLSISAIACLERSLVEYDVCTFSNSLTSEFE